MHSIVVFNDGNCLCLPYGLHPDGDGSLVIAGKEIPVAVFPDVAAARQAIRISRAKAVYLDAAGRRPHDWDDFSDSDARKAVKVEPARLVDADGGGA